MTFRIRGLDAAPFQPLFNLDAASLKDRQAIRQTADASPGFPCRISLTDAPVGAEVILVNYEHQSADTPYRSRHAIYVREGEETYDAIGRVPEQLRIRTLSLRAFDAAGFIRAADLVAGTALEIALEALLADPDVAYVQAHFAKFGCYAARIERA
jgi:hypothetical protein